jgi:hypothetical protein
MNSLRSYKVFNIAAKGVYGIFFKQNVSEYLSLATIFNTSAIQEVKTL